MTPASAFAALVRDRTEQVPLADLDGRTSAVTCLLYPQGIPVVVPGEWFDARVRATASWSSAGCFASEDRVPAGAGP
jgi:arginine/lysine/ornithine decarboxylase